MKKTESIFESKKGNKTLIGAIDADALAFEGVRVEAIRIVFDLVADAPGRFSVVRIVAGDHSEADGSIFHRAADGAGRILCQ